MPYICSVCQAKIDGDLLAIKDHSEQHIVELIQEARPDWVADDGICHKCYDYYKKQLAGSNIAKTEEMLSPPRKSGMISGIKKFFGKKT